MDPVRKATYVTQALLPMEALKSQIRLTERWATSVQLGSTANLETQTLMTVRQAPTRMGLEQEPTATVNHVQVAMFALPHSSSIQLLSVLGANTVSGRIKMSVLLGTTAQPAAWRHYVASLELCNKHKAKKLAILVLLGAIATGMMLTQMPTQPHLLEPRSLSSSTVLLAFTVLRELISTVSTLVP